MNIVKHVMRWLAVGLSLSHSPAASAATVAFDFTSVSSGTWTNSLQIGAGGVTMTVSATTATGGTAMVQTKAKSGLGVKSSADCVSYMVCHGLDRQIDTVGPNDLALFHFDVPVRILSLDFGFTSAHDAFDLLVNGVRQLHATAQPSVSVLTPFATDFGVGASIFDRTLCRMSRAKNPRRICRTYSWDSAFTLTGMLVEYLPTVTPVPAPVPVPASGALLAGVLAMLSLRGGHRRRQGSAPRAGRAGQAVLVGQVDRPKSE